MSMTTFERRPQAEISPGLHWRASLKAEGWVDFISVEESVTAAAISATAGRRNRMLMLNLRVANLPDYSTHQAKTDLPQDRQGRDGQKLSLAAFAAFGWE